MKVVNMLEMIRQVFPEKQEAQVKLDLNTAYQLYSEETRLPFEDYDVVVYNGALAIGTTALAIAGGDYTLPLPVKDIVKVTAYDASDNIIENPYYYYWFSGNQFNISQVIDDTLVMGGSLPAGIVRLRFRCTIIPSALSADNDAPDYPEQFHQALVDHVFSKYFALKGILQQSGWFRSSYDAGVKAGKRYFNRNL